MRKYCNKCQRVTRRKSRRDRITGPCVVCDHAQSVARHLGLTRGYLERKPPKRALSPFSLEYAMARWLQNFKKVNGASPAFAAHGMHSESP